jgi:FMN phosphatase YigB (HAD superfamily)
MMIKNYLFDLDGTLLPLDEELFIKHYFGLLAQKFMELKLNPEVMIKKLWAGTKAMIENDGKYTNEKVFWDTFYPEALNQDELKNALEEFYLTTFEDVKISSSLSPYSKKIIDLLKQRDKNIVLATNPVFPLVATKKRISWAGLHHDDFLHITSYENSNFAKPSINYYEMILKRMNFLPEETIMIGNDSLEDMVAMGLGVKTFLVTDCLNNKNDIDINQFENGSLKDLYEKIKNEEF